MELICFDKCLFVLFGIFRGEVWCYIEGGWVMVNGEVVEQLQWLVDDSVVIVVVEQVSDEKVEWVSMLLYKLVGVVVDVLCVLVSGDSCSEFDVSDICLLQCYFYGLQLVVVFLVSDSGLVVVSQDLVMQVYLQCNLGCIEQEYLIEVVEGGFEWGLWLLVWLQQEFGGVKVSW